MLVLMFLVLTVRAERPATARASVTTPEAAALARADAAATRLATTLKGKVLTEMGKGGPMGAVGACQAEAPATSAAIRSETGVTVGRSSLRLRNPANAGPDWVQAWLRAQGERPAAGVVGVSEVVAGTAHVLKPIALDAPCLACHGAAVDPGTQGALGARYPHDLAVGYALGDLRGALWAEVPVTP